MNQSQYQETIDVRSGQDFDRIAFETYLRQHLDGLPQEPLQVTQFPTGVSNLTYLIKCGNWEAVMRRPPFGQLPPKAHDMKREEGLLRKLSAAFPLVPKPYVSCEDKTVIGVPFYVMERKKGIVLDDQYLDNHVLSKEECRMISTAMVDTLSKLHQVDYKKSDLSYLGYPDGFLARQVHGWIKRYEQFQTDDLVIFERLANWLVNHIPVSTEATIIHNDYKINNMLLSHDLSQVVAVLDWEMATIADPLFDLGCALSYWVQEDDPDTLKNSLPSVTATPGFISRREFIHLYSLKTGKDIPSLQFYLTFNYFKLAIVFQQFYYRWKIGQVEDDRYGEFIGNVKDLMNYAYEVSEKKIQ